MAESFLASGSGRTSRHADPECLEVKQLEIEYGIGDFSGMHHKPGKCCQACNNKDQWFKIVFDVDRYRIDAKR